MAQHPVSDAAFEGFRVTREHPTAVLLWAVLLFVSAILTGAILAASPLPGLIAMVNGAAKPGVAPMPEDIQRVSQAMVRQMPALMGPMLEVVLIGMVVQALVQTAVNRAVLQPDAKAFGYLRFGAAELRTFIVLLAVTVLMLAIYFIGALVIAVLSTFLGALGGLVVAVGFLALVAALVIVAVRLSLAVPATFAARRLAFAESLALTRGRFWPLVGAYVIALVMVVLVLILGQVISLGVEAALGQSGPPAVIASLSQVLTPVGVILHVVDAVLSAMAYVILYAVSAAIYRLFTGRSPAQAF